MNTAERVTTALAVLMIVGCAATATVDRSVEIPVSRGVGPTPWISYVPFRGGGGHYFNSGPGAIAELVLGEIAASTPSAKSREAREQERIADRAKTVAGLSERLEGEAHDETLIGSFKATLGWKHPTDHAADGKSTAPSVELRLTDIGLAEFDYGGSSLMLGICAEAIVFPKGARFKRCRNAGISPSDVADADKFMTILTHESQRLGQEMAEAMSWRRD